MNYVKIDKCDFNNGDGVRTTLWVSGCPLHCKGCHNKQLWDKNYGKHFNTSTIDEIIESLKSPYISGLSILGGEPLAPYNIASVLHTIEMVKLYAPDKDIWLWTGYNENEINFKELFDKGLDVLIYGRFIQELKIDGNYFGSSNQKILKSKEYYLNHK